MLWLIIRDKHKKSKIHEEEHITVGATDDIQKGGAKTEESPIVSLPKIELIVIQGKQTGKRYTLSFDQSKKTLGREGTDVIIEDKEISKIHCSIVWGKDRFMIQDEESTNGTFLNGIPLKTRTIIEDGDTVDLGQCKLRVKVIKNHS